MRRSNRKPDETEEERADRMIRFQVALGVSILIGVIVGMILLLVLSANRSARRPNAGPLFPGQGFSLAADHEAAGCESADRKAASAPDSRVGQRADQGKRQGKRLGY